MSNYTKQFFDFNDVEDTSRLFQYAGSGIKDTEVTIRDLEGNLRFQGRNAIILPGAAFTAQKHFQVTPPIVLPNYNTAIGLEQTINTAPEAPEFTYLFAVGTDGCGPEASQINVVNYKKWTEPASLVPFKFGALDILTAERLKYFGRKVVGVDAATRYAYYFKGFEAAPVMYMQYKDGTPIDAAIYSSANEMAIETYVELRLRVSNTDCREYFKNTTGIATAKVNTIMLLRAWPKTINGHTYYQNIQPITKLNISNESLVDETKGLDIIYHLYY